MELMGTTLVVVLTSAAVLIPIATLLLWSRVRGPRAVRGFARLLLLGAGQVVTVALVAVLANNYGQFYTSWSDLLGTNQAPAKVAVYGGHDHGSRREVRVAATSVGTATGRLQILGDYDWSTPRQWSTRGKVVSTTLTGLRSGLSTSAYVYLPPQYFWKKYAHRRFPAVEVLTGFPGAALSLVGRMDYPAQALTLVHKHRAVPMIYVMLSSTVAPPRDTECTNIAGGPQAMTFLSGELTSAVEHTLRVKPGHWGVIGHSTGGYCAAKLAMFYPSVYAGGVSLAGYYHALDGGTAGSLFGGSIAREHQNDLRWLLTHYPAPPANLYLTITQSETTSDQGYPETLRFLHLVRPPMRATAVIEPTGGHNYTTWIRELPSALSWLSGRISAPTTPPNPTQPPMAVRRGR